MPFSKNIIASDTIRYTTNIVDPFLQLEELKLMLVVTALTIGLYLLLQPRERSYLKKKLLALVAGRFFKTALQISTIFAVHLSFGEAVQDSSVTYEKVTACLKNRDGNNKNFDVKKLDHLKFPSDAEKHYQELLELTSQYRNHRPHSWAGFSGPWIENIWIDHFMKKPLSSFSGMIPLFIQWTDIHVNFFAGGNASVPAYGTMPENIVKLLREDVIYVMVTQDDEGFGSRIANPRPNILSISAGGFGHISIPLIKGELDYVEPHKFSHDVSFLGSLHPRLSRSGILNEMERCVRNVYSMSYEGGSSPLWKKVVEVTKFNLAPRGFGRTSYRLAEVIQIGRIPVYMYDDSEWLPYGDSNISVKSFGFSGQMHKLCDLAKQLNETTEAQLKDRLERVKIAREYYTYDGVVKQLEMFFGDPLGSAGGQLVCSRLPDSDHRRLLGKQSLVHN